MHGSWRLVQLGAQILHATEPLHFVWVATIKPSADGKLAAPSINTPGVSRTMNVTARNLIEQAYRIPWTPGLNTSRSGRSGLDRQRSLRCRGPYRPIASGRVRNHVERAAGSDQPNDAVATGRPVQAQGALRTLVEPRSEGGRARTAPAHAASFPDITRAEMTATSPGSGATLRASTATYSASVPSRVQSVRPNTRCPTDSPVVP